MAYFSSSTPATMQLCFCLFREPPQSCKSHHCWNNSGKVPKVCRQAVSVIWPIYCPSLYIQGGCPALAALLQIISSSAMKRLGQTRKVSSAHDAAWYSGGSQISRSSQWYRFSFWRSFPDWTNWTSPACILPSSHVPSSFATFSMFSLQFPSATRRSVLSVSDMSSKNCDRMESIWDLGPMIWRIKTRRRPCRLRSRKAKGLLKSAPFALCLRHVKERAWAWSLPFAPHKPLLNRVFEGRERWWHIDDDDGWCGHVEAEGTRPPATFFAIQMFCIDHRHSPDYLLNAPWPCRWDRQQSTPNHALTPRAATVWSIHQRIPWPAESRKRFLNLSRDLQSITSTEQVQRNLL